MFIILYNITYKLQDVNNVKILTIWSFVQTITMIKMWHVNMNIITFFNKCCLNFIRE